MKINLLPSEAKTELFEEEIKKLITILGGLVLFFLISLTLILFSIEIYISAQVSSRKAQLDMQEEQLRVPEIQNLKEKITKANQNLSKLDSFYEGQIKLGEIFEKISKILLPNMYLTVFSYQKTTTTPPPPEEKYVAQVSLSGYAPNRETLLEFNKTLEKEFFNPSFSPQSWFRPADFQVNFKIRK